MSFNLRFRSKGFSILEITMVLVIIAFVSALAIPKYVENANAQLLDAKIGKSSSVKSALTLALVDIKSFPSVSQLSGYVQGEDVSINHSGIVVKINGRNYVVPTFKNALCQQKTSSVDDLVQCVGNIK